MYFRCNMETWKLESRYKHWNIWTVRWGAKIPKWTWFVVMCLMSFGSWKVKKILYKEVMSTPFLCFMGLWHQSGYHVYCWRQITVLFPLYMQSTGPSQFPLSSCMSTCAEETSFPVEDRIVFIFPGLQKKTVTVQGALTCGSFRHTLQVQAAHHCAHTSVCWLSPCSSANQQSTAKKVCGMHDAATLPLQ